METDKIPVPVNKIFLHYAYLLLRRVKANSLFFILFKNRKSHTISVKYQG